MWISKLLANKGIRGPWKFLFISGFQIHEKSFALLKDTGRKIFGYTEQLNCKIFHKDEFNQHCLLKLSAKLEKLSLCILQNGSCYHMYCHTGDVWMGDRGNEFSLFLVCHWKNRCGWLYLTIEYRKKKVKLRNYYIRNKYCILYICYFWVKVLTADNFLSFILRMRMSSINLNMISTIALISDDISQKKASFLP